VKPRRFILYLSLMIATPYLSAISAQAQVQTTVTPSLPTLPDDDKPPRDDSPVICRPGQHQSGSRLLTPPVCKTRRQWDDLHARGLELYDDGKSTYHTSQKYGSEDMRVCRNAGECPP